MNKELGLAFNPANKKFIEMMSGLQNLMLKKENKRFFLDASAECEKKLSSSFIGSSNKLTGWLIAIDEIDSFVAAFERNDLEVYVNQKINVWSYWDGECSGGWLYSFEGPIFGEVDTRC